jgi:hypothetical protein
MEHRGAIPTSINTNMRMSTVMANRVSRNMIMTIRAIMAPTITVTPDPV